MKDGAKGRDGGRERERWKGREGRRGRKKTDRLDWTN